MISNQHSSPVSETESLVSSRGRGGEERRANESSTSGSSSLKSASPPRGTGYTGNDYSVMHSIRTDPLFAAPPGDQLIDCFAPASNGEFNDTNDSSSFQFSSSDGLQAIDDRSFGEYFPSEQDEKNHQRQKFSSRVIQKLKQTLLHDIDSENLDDTEPLSHHIEDDTVSVRIDVYRKRDGRTLQFEQDELPLSNTELAEFRRNLRNMRRSRISAWDETDDNNGDESMPFRWDEDGRPIALRESERTPNVRMIRKIGRELASPTTKLSEDSVSFLISARTWSSPFNFAVVILAIKGMLFILICINLIDLTDEDNPLGIPAGITIAVALAQFLAVFIAVASQDDLRTSLNYFYEGYEDQHLGSAFVGSNYWKWLIATWLKFFEGALGLATTFFLIVGSDDVVGLMLDFTAVEFITLLDNAFFMLARQGFVGPKNRLESEIILNTHYRIPAKRVKTPTRQIGTLLGTILILMMGWTLIYTRQIQGYYTPQSIVVQFDDDLRPELGAYSGVYTLATKVGSDIDRLSYTAVTGDGIFGYCYKSKFWTFSFNSSDACDDFVARSSRSLSFDITDAGEEPWFVTENSALQRYFPMENFLLELVCDRDRDCGGVGRGICESHTCKCHEQHYYGIRCDYEVEEACEMIRVDERRDAFRARREFARSYALLRDINGDIVQTYHHPVYVSNFGNTPGLDIMMYVGVRWTLSHSIDALPQLDDEEHTYAGLANYLSTVKLRAYKDLKSLAFFTEPVIFNTPDDGDSPVGIRWFSALESDLTQTERMGSVDTIMLCAVCDNSTNPCQNGNELECGAENRICDCKNGTDGTLCQITPLSNGRCNTYFNTASYKYDGGDCCHSTCSSTESDSCGVLQAGNLAKVDVGFPFCEDPTVRTSCGNDVCWARLSSQPYSIAPGLPILTKLSANGRIYVGAIPELDIVAVYDQLDSSWMQRGRFHEGRPGSNFGKILAVSTSPGQVINRRFGKIPILLAMGSSGNGTAGVSVVRWEPNSADWDTVADELQICGDEGDPEDCDIVALDIGRSGDQATLIVVRNDDQVLIYRIVLTVANSNWVLVYGFQNKQLSDNGLFSGVSLSGNTGVVAISRGYNFNVLYLPSSEIPVDEQAVWFNKSTHFHVNVSREMESSSGAPTETGAIHAIQISEDGTSLLLYAFGKTEEDMAVVLQCLVHATGEKHPYATGFLSINATSLSDEEAKNGLSLVRFSADASSLAVRVATPEGPRIRIAVFDDTVFDALTDRKAEFRNKFLSANLSLADDLNDTIKRDFALSYDGSVVIQADEDGNAVYGLAPRCPDDSSYYRVSVTLDDNPRNISWSLQTYQTFGNLSVPDEVFKDCFECYYDNGRFGRSLVAEDLCIPKMDDPCARVVFESKAGLQSGSGLVVFHNGYDKVHHESNSTDQFLFVLQPNESAKCEAPTVLQCNADEVYILIELRFDRFPQDNAWELNSLGNGNETSLLHSFNFSDFEEVDDAAEKGLNNTYSTDGSLPTITQLCGKKGDKFNFTILDRWNDGICCSSGRGSYTIYLEDEEVYSMYKRDRNFTTEQVLFDSNGTVQSFQLTTV